MEEKNEAIEIQNPFIKSLYERSIKEANHHGAEIIYSHGIFGRMLMVGNPCSDLVKTIKEVDDLVNGAKMDGLMYDIDEVAGHIISAALFLAILDSGSQPTKEQLQEVYTPLEELLGYWVELVDFNILDYSQLIDELLVEGKEFEAFDVEGNYSLTVLFNSSPLQSNGGLYEMLLDDPNNISVVVCAKIMYGILKYGDSSVDRSIATLKKYFGVEIEFFSCDLNGYVYKEGQKWSSPIAMGRFVLDNIEKFKKTAEVPPEHVHLQIKNGRVSGVKYEYEGFPFVKFIDDKSNDVNVSIDDIIAATIIILSSEIYTESDLKEAIAQKFGMIVEFDDIEMDFRPPSKTGNEFEEPAALNDVAEFSRQFSYPVEPKPTMPDEKTAKLRVSLLEEEVKELAEAIKNCDLVAVADAFADIQYVLSGGIHAFGMGAKFKQIFDEVHRSNMSKTCVGQDSAEKTLLKYSKLYPCHVVSNDDGTYNVVRTEDNKLLKSVDYSEANLTEIVLGE